ncbi:uclacyanin-3 [Pyrus ussuriensis x Pyrus communis]|uniref:Uclacyanin-3 n=1 Tax=Pyrus ussuriensis x Pyrus communis TaxID=2448454 RepID=A0A5N5EX76_9ROSA|nr:uclacyanin-3 [Pyrus ussuriensis x Pyrus communis]
MAIATALLILLLAAPTVYGVQHIVGDTSGWSTSVDYDSWAASNTFTVGDTLVFNYGSSHKVDIVNQADYASCSSSNSLKTYDDGATTITLSQPGPAYFICPSAGHCANGMKLSVNVVAAGTPSGTPSTTPPSTPTTPGSNPSPPPPPPPPKGAANSLDMNMLGFPLVLATLVAFMG